jgi:hypothetical protein
MWPTLLIVSLKETNLESYTKLLPGLDSRFAMFLLAQLLLNSYILNYFSWKDHLNTCNNCLACEYVPKNRELSTAIPINEDDAPLYNPLICKGNR